MTDTELHSLIGVLEQREWLQNIDAPDSETGTWWLDVEVEGQPYVIAWKRGKGFGVSGPDEAAFGEGHEKVFTTVDRLIGYLLRSTG